MKSKYATDGPTDYEMRRAELKTRPPEEQAAAAARERQYQATYRERNRNDLRIWEANRRLAVYKAKHGPEAYTSYVKAQHVRRRNARAKRKAQEAYDSRDDHGAGRDDGRQASTSRN
ncbi:hypothetical protein C8R45DRAFT_1115371 [Mycena sanguinolenta]|nr:hypothetical protein C8R45DRAFT_1115371 [Mycena sanguinolenta]